MSFNAWLLLLRILIVVTLYSFLAALFYVAWRDLHITMRETAINETEARLIVLESGELPLEIGRAFPLQRVATIGRNPSSTIPLQETFVSTEHARIFYRSGQWWLEDLGSRNGTLLNDIPTSDLVVLSSEDVIGIGNVKFQFETR